MAKEKFLLAYSGGLDTSIIIPWLLEHYDCEVVAYCGEVGVGVDHDYLEKKALKCGAIKCIIEDITDEFVSDFVYPTLKANAVYEGKYLLGTSMARPVIAKHFVEAAHANGCTTIVHGCT
ncbi:MAG: argininosuccinate synthase, partial [Lachnospiraceae bacterium]|nr:argininosuccinate synthase [Lachnospiraceae bacterium]